VGFSEQGMFWHHEANFHMVVVGLNGIYADGMDLQWIFYAYKCAS
jgi:hypothetical protein